MLEKEKRFKTFSLQEENKGLIVTKEKMVYCQKIYYYQILE